MKTESAYGFQAVWALRLGASRGVNTDWVAQRARRLQPRESSPFTLRPRRPRLVECDLLVGNGANRCRREGPISPPWSPVWRSKWGFCPPPMGYQKRAKLYRKCTALPGSGFGPERPFESGPNRQLRTRPNQDPVLNRPRPKPAPYRHLTRAPRMACEAISRDGGVVGARTQERPPGRRCGARLDSRDFAWSFAARRRGIPSIFSAKNRNGRRCYGY